MTDSPEPPATPADMRHGMNHDSDPMRAAALAPALPSEVERDAETGKITGGSAAADTKDRNLMRQVLEEAEHQRHAKCRAHIATLTRERDEARETLLHAWKNDATRYDYGDPRRGDQMKAPPGQRWQTPREIIEQYLRSVGTDIWAELARLDAGEGQPR